MVHGNYYGVQYEIYLNRELDLYNDVLPICIDVRTMISMQQQSGQYKLVIVPYREFTERFSGIKLSPEYVSSLNKIEYSHMTKTTNPELFKYYDVKMYAELIKPCKDLSSYDNILNGTIGPQETYGKLSDALIVQDIIRNADYFEEIKAIERELTNIDLTDSEKTLINSVINHAKLEGAIDRHGINLVYGVY